MSLVRTGSELHLSAPPPSPIPTAKGSRSAANEILCDYLAKSLNVPELSLPDPHLPLNDAHQIPAEIDYRCLELSDYETIDRLLMSAREFGAFRITSHGIFDDELRSLVSEVDQVFRDLEQADVGFRGKSFKRIQNKEQIEWSRSRKGRIKCAPDYFVPERYRDFSEKMENIASKLDAIAELLGKIFVENIARMQFGKRIQGKESSLSIYKYNHKDNYMIRNPSSSSERNSKTCDHIFCLHLPATPSRFFLRSAQGPLSFDAGPDTIVVIVGHRIEEWSMGDFICVCEEVICVPRFQGSQAPISIELKCLSLNFDPNSNKNCNTISIRDQILFVLVIALLYKTFVFLFS
ncbi:hypothetical protein P3X46_005111 [Hevea brasiliensis]|uniref:Non-haem dioxygenase N-terminal domain-containing protein n=1 Tax=Hevea brasiliensis TaxID=3981 RepID=A0ABQ9N069_HEVBR|nr:uncharacterized protein LOC110639450 [Hevea brasiliensis]KAJ9185474.1 hypothetical protein P3X46_005111 [Hevea brasiliensis]